MAEIKVKIDNELLEQLKELCKIQDCSIDEYIKLGIITKYEFDEHIKFTQFTEKLNENNEMLNINKIIKEYLKALNADEKIFINAVMHHIEDNISFGKCGSYLMRKDKRIHKDNCKKLKIIGTKLEFKEFEIT